MFSIQNVNVNKIGSAELPDIVYYNADIINGRTIDEGEERDPKARYNENRDTAIIKDCSKYYFSIVRFTMNGPDLDLPLLIPRIELGQPNINLTVYYISQSLEVSYNIPAVGVRTNTFYTSQPIIYQPQNINSRLPLPPLTTQDLGTAYYFINNYFHMVNLVNNTFNACLVDLQNQFNLWWVAEGGVAPAPALTTQALYMDYTPDNKRFQIYGDSYGWGVNDSLSFNNPNAKETFKLWFNSNMYGLFGNFPNIDEGGDLVGSNIQQRLNYTYQILFSNKLGSNIYRPLIPNNLVIPPTPSYYVIDQSHISTSSLWSPISSIVFVSTLIPILNEQSGEPIAFGSNNITNAGQSQSAFQPIITDISIPLESADGYNQLIQYVPTAEYRLSSMSNSPQEVRNIDISVYWKNRLDNNLYPITMFNLSSISIKIMFRRRDV